jgi:hypothetical protein
MTAAKEKDGRSRPARRRPIRLSPRRFARPVFAVAASPPVIPSPSWCAKAQRSPPDRVGIGRRMNVPRQDWFCERTKTIRGPRACHVTRRILPR